MPGGSNEARPCLFERCRYHLKSPTHSCTLDAADEGGMTLEDVGNILGLTRERIRQIEVLALRKLNKRIDRRIYD